MFKNCFYLRIKKKKEKIYFFRPKANPLPNINKAIANPSIGTPVACIGTVSVLHLQ